MPLYRRILRGNSGATDLARTVSGHRTVWNKGEPQKRMELAIRDIESGVLSVREAAETYNIPKSTLHDHVSGKVDPGASVGPPKYLTDEEEEEVVKWLEGCAKIGCAKSVKDVRAIVGAIIAKKQGVQCFIVSHGWWDRFKQRHHHLSLRAGESLAYKRAIVTNPEVIRNYFDQLESVLEENHLLQAPTSIYNADESGMSLQPCVGRRIAVRGQKHINVINAGNKGQVTVLACVNASGQSLPPMVIFKRKSLNESLIKGEVPNTIYGLSDSGWMDGDLFFKWFHSHFLKHIPSCRPILLLLDGHLSHYNPDMIKEAARNGIILFCLPPNTTHVAQPLDVAPFHSLKVYWDQACNDYMSSHPWKTVTIYEFNQLFAKAWFQSMIPSTIIAGFRVAGVYSVNRKAIHIPGIEDVATPTAKIAKEQGIKYLPFYTPRKKFQRSVSPFPSLPTCTSPHFVSESKCKMTLNFSALKMVLFIFYLHV